MKSSPRDYRVLQQRLRKGELAMVCISENEHLAVIPRTSKHTRGEVLVLYFVTASLASWSYF